MNLVPSFAPICDREWRLSPWRVSPEEAVELTRRDVRIVMEPCKKGERAWWVVHHNGEETICESMREAMDFADTLP